MTQPQNPIATVGPDSGSTTLEIVELASLDRGHRVPDETSPPKLDFAFGHYEAA